MSSGLNILLHSYTLINSLVVSIVGILYSLFVISLIVSITGLLTNLYLNIANPYIYYYFIFKAFSGW